MSTDPPMNPGGQFPTPASSSTPLLALRCAPAIKPYLPEDASAPASFVVSAPLTNLQVAGAAPVELPAHGPLGTLEVTVTAKTKGKTVTLAHGPVPVNASKVELPFSLAGLSPQMDAFDVECTATLGKQTFSASTALAYLPDPPEGRSVTKMDARTGALLARPADGKGGPYESVFPVGFYTDFGSYLAANLSVIDEIAAQGFTVVSAAFR